MTSKVLQTTVGNIMCQTLTISKDFLENICLEIDSVFLVKNKKF